MASMSGFWAFFGYKKAASVTHGVVFLPDFNKALDGGSSYDG